MLDIKCRIFISFDRKLNFVFSHIKIFKILLKCPRKNKKISILEVSPFSGRQSFMGSPRDSRTETLVRGDQQNFWKTLTKADRGLPT